MFLTENESVREYLQSSPLHDNPHWKSLFNAILNTGVRFTSASRVHWLAGYSHVPATPKSTSLKAHFFKMHDLFHQISPVEVSGKYDEDSRVQFKKSSMCGEVAVLYLTEFRYAEALAEAKPEWEEDIRERKSLPLLDLMRRKGVLAWEDQVACLDNLLYGDSFFPFLQGEPEVKDFIEDYWSMFERDRGFLDHNWELLKGDKWEPKRVISYDPTLNHLELTKHMVKIFLYIQMVMDVRLREDLRIQNMHMRFWDIPQFGGWLG